MRRAGSSHRAKDITSGASVCCRGVVYGTELCAVAHVEGLVQVRVTRCMGLHHDCICSLNSGYMFFLALFENGDV
jgi:hypothetical protein